MNHQGHQEHQDIAVFNPADETDRIARQVVDSAFAVHKEIGPGLLESAYELFLMHELLERGLVARTQVPVQASYKGKIAETGFHADMIVNDKVLIELKTVEKILPIHEARILTYLKFSKIKVGLLINFNTRLIKDGIRRYAL